MQHMNHDCFGECGKFDEPASSTSVKNRRNSLNPVVRDLPDTSAVTGSGRQCCHIGQHVCISPMQPHG